MSSQLTSYDSQSNDRFNRQFTTKSDRFFSLNHKLYTLGLMAWCCMSVGVVCLILSITTPEALIPAAVILAIGTVLTVVWLSIGALIDELRELKYSN